MDNSERDIFEFNTQSDKNTTVKNFSQTVFTKNSANFFMAAGVPTLKSSTEPSRRLNDYDFNLLEEDAYKEVTDDVFKLECKILKIEEYIIDLENQIQSAEAINDEERIIHLKERLVTLQDEYETALSVYNAKSVSTKITGCLSSVFTDILKNKISLIRNKFINISDKIISKMPAKVASVIELKKSLNKLRNINKSVDTLINLNTPYGENTDKYEKITKYIVKANSIHSGITKQLK